VAQDVLSHGMQFRRTWKSEEVLLVWLLTVLDRSGFSLPLRICCLEQDFRLEIACLALPSERSDQFRFKMFAKLVEFPLHLWNFIEQIYTKWVFFFAWALVALLCRRTRSDIATGHFPGPPLEQEEVSFRTICLHVH